MHDGTKNAAASSQPRLIALHPEDNVLVALGAVGPGACQIGAQGEITLHSAITLGHKVAARPIAAGETVFKYGMPIGIATRDIARGEHVHVHNIASRYTETHYRGDEAGL